ncbi:MAG: ArnT family glycosyltransferase [Chitinophagaceae bacterium]
MRAFLQKNHRFVFYASLLLLGIMQSVFTELQDDEAYYWVYSHYPAWGYFDHPPMIALLIKTGYSILPNELGVRLFPLLMNIGTIYIIENLLNKKNQLLFYCIALSIAIMQVVGFLAIPDIPLLFFTALFFLWYRRFVATPSVANALLLGFVIALMLYSKYHAGLIVLFTLFSNFSLLKKNQTWLAGLFALLLFAPHLWWQYQHNWVSFRYHLFESNAASYKISFTTDYLWSQVLLAGPLAGLILLPAAFLYKPNDAVEKAMRYTMIGIYVFFFISTFRGKVEANWTLPAFVCFYVLSHQWLVENIRYLRLMTIMAVLTTIIVVICRIGMVEDVLPLKVAKERFHMWKDWPLTMRKKIDGLPVVFNSSYQRASKFWFYSGEMTYSLNLYKERKNNFNFWPVEDSLLGKPVFVLDKYNLPQFSDSIKTPLGYVGYRYDSSFISFAKIKIETERKNITCKRNDPLSISYSFHIPPYYSRFIQSNEILRDTTRIGVFNSNGWIRDIYTPLSLKEAVKNPSGQLSLPHGLSPGKYYILFAINSGRYYPTHNSDKIKLIIK